MINATRTNARIRLTGRRPASYRAAMTRVIAALFLAVAGVTLQATPTHAADPACFNKSDRIVTPEEYDQLVPGMSLAEVRTITGGSGVPMDPHWLVIASGHMERTWKVCGRSGWVLMSFDRVEGQGWPLSWTDVRWS